MDELQTPISGPDVTPQPPIIPTAPAKSSLGLVVKIIAGVVVVAVVGAGIALGTRIWDPLWNPFRPEPEEVIDKMIIKMKEVKTIHSEMEIGLTTKRDEEEIFNLSMTVVADSDYTDSENLKSAGNFKLNLSSEGMQFSLTGEGKAIGEIFFVKLTTIPALPFLQPYLTLFGIDLSEIKNQWIKYDQESYLKAILGEMYAQEMEEQFKKQKEKQKEMVAKIKDIIKDKKLYLAKKEFPDEKIQEVKVYHYLVALDKEEAKKVILELLEISGEYSESFFSSLTVARAKAKEARVIADMYQLRTIAELIYDDEGGYRKSSCDYSGYDVSTICEDIAKQVGTKPVIHATYEEYCVYAPILVQGYYYCLDSQFNAQITTDPGRSGFCDGKTFICPEEVNKEEIEAAREKVAKEEFLKEMDEFFEKIGETEAELWIGKKDNLLYKTKGEKEIAASQFEEGAEGKAIIKFDLEFSKFNEPIKIEAPGKYKSLEEILGGGETFMSPFVESQQRAAEARIKADMSQLRVAAEIIYIDEGGSYANVSCQNEDMKLICDDIKNYTGIEPIIYAFKNEYCAYVKLTSEDKYWCVDSQGYAGDAICPIKGTFNCTLHK